MQTKTDNYLNGFFSLHTNRPYWLRQGYFSWIWHIQLEYLPRWVSPASGKNIYKLLFSRMLKIHFEYLAFCHCSSKKSHLGRHRRERAQCLSWAWTISKSRYATVFFISHLTVQSVMAEYSSVHSSIIHSDWSVMELGIKPNCQWKTCMSIKK